MSPEKFSFRLQHEAEVSQSALYLVGQVLVNRNAGSRILAKINAKISAGCIVKLHLCLSFSLPPSQNCSCLSSIALICFKCFRPHFELAQKHIQKHSRNMTQGGMHPDAFAGWLHGGVMSSGVLSDKKYRAWLKSFECKSRGESGDGAATGLSDVLPDMSCSAGWRGVAAQSILKFGCRQGLSTVHRGRKQDARRSTTKAPHYKSQKTLLLNQESMKVWISIVMGGSAVGVLSH